MVLDPGVLFHFPPIDLGQVVAAVEQVVAFSDNAHAGQVVVQGNVPEPTPLRQKGHGGGPAVDPRVAFRAPEIGPDGDLVQGRVPFPPIVLFDREDAPPAGVDRHRCAELRGALPARFGRRRRRPAAPRGAGRGHRLSSSTSAPFSRALSSSI